MPQPEYRCGKGWLRAALLTVAAADNVIRLLPALNIPDADITEALARLDRAASDVANNA